MSKRLQLVGSFPSGTTDYNDLENKPCGIDVVEILSETTVTPEETGEFPFFESLGLRSGETYAVTWNGTTYNCTAVSYAEEGVTGVIIGNLAASGIEGAEDTGEPFFVIELPEETAAEVGLSALGVALDGSTSVTLSISGPGIKQLDNIYLEPFTQIKQDYSEVLPYQKLTVTYDNSSFATSIDDTLPLLAGKAYVVRFDGTEYRCVCQQYTAVFDDGITVATCLGNTQIGFNGFGENTGEPFCICVSSRLDGTQILVSARSGTVEGESEEHAFHIYAPELDETRLKPEFLPWGYTKKELVDAVIAALPTYNGEVESV